MAQFDFRESRALVVEDNEFVRLTIRTYLAEFGFKEILEAANGFDGIALLGANPDIIICDINMEPLNGFEFLKHLRAAKSTVPVIFLSGDAYSATVRQAIDLSVNAYIVKPVSAENLKEKVTLLMSAAKNKA